MKIGSLYVWLVALFLMSNATHARIYKFVDANGVVTYTERKPRGTAFKVIRFDCLHYGRDCPKGRQVDFNRTPLNKSAYKKEISLASKTYNVDAALIRAVIHAESSFNPKAQSHKGAQGLMQLMPVTQRIEGVHNPFNPVANINAGARILARLLKRYGGDVQLACAAYHAGEGAVNKYGGIPPFQSTQTYVQRIQILRRRYAG